MINIENEQIEIQNRMKDLETKGYKATGKPRKAIYNNLILESDLEEYQALSNMNNMLKHSDSNTLNEELYNKYKDIANKHLTKDQEAEVELEITDQPTQTIDIQTELETIKKRIDELEADIADSEDITWTVEGKRIKNSNLEEYKSLISMQNLLKYSSNVDIDLFNQYKEHTKLAKAPEKSFAIDLSPIKKRIEEIKYNKLTAKGEKEIVIAGGDPVLKQDSEEYQTLKTIEYIVEHNAISRKEELNQLINKLKVMRKTEIVPAKDLGKNEEEPIPEIVQKEIKTIQNRMKEIEDSGKLADSFESTTEVGENKKVRLKDLGEYDKLKDLLAVIDSKFQNEDAEKYNDIRAMTSLGKLPQDQFEELCNSYKKSNKEDSIDIGNLDIPKQDENPNFEFKPIQKSVSNGSELALSSPSAMIQTKTRYRKKTRTTSTTKR